MIFSENRKSLSLAITQEKDFFKCTTFDYEDGNALSGGTLSQKYILKGRKNFYQNSQGEKELNFPDIIK